MVNNLTLQNLQISRRNDSSYPFSETDASNYLVSWLRFSRSFFDEKTSAMRSNWSPANVCIVKFHVVGKVKLFPSMDFTNFSSNRELHLYVKCIFNQQGQPIQIVKCLEKDSIKGARIYVIINSVCGSQNMGL